MKPETIPSLDEIEYPDSDGQPMAENTRQFQIIMTIQGNLDAIFRDNPDVFVAGDLLWYARQGDPRERLAPDAMVAFGRPKGHRGSYMQWVEGGIAPQVVWEVLSPSNTTPEMADKRAFYERHGVCEYYEYDPDRGLLRGWIRRGQVLDPVLDMQGHVSPLLQVRMELDELDELILYRPNGTPFLSFLDLDAGFVEAREEARQERLAREEAERQTAEANRQVVEVARQAAEAQRQAAEAREQAAESDQRAADAEARLAQLAARLRALGMDPEEGS